MLTIYKASAGSGKTFTLAYEYIKTLLGVKEPGAERYHLNSAACSPSGRRLPNRHRGILAITFTNAATDEMKSRIVRELAKLAAREGLDSSIYAKWMTEEFRCDADALCDAAAKALSEMLYDYGNFNVSTIDSFFQGVLRTFSREIDHQGDYELSLDTMLSVKQSISVMLDEINYARPRNAERLGRWIRRFTISKMGEGKGFNFFHRDGAILNSLTETMASALDETYGASSKELRQYLEDPSRIEEFGRQLKEKQKELLEEPAAMARGFFAALASAGIPAEVFQAPVVRCMRAVADGKAPEDFKTTLLKAADGTNPPEKLVVGTKAKSYGLSLTLLEPHYTAMAAFCREIVTAWPMARLYGELADSLGVLDFFGMALNKLEEYLRENNTVLISDTGELLKRIISDAEMPFIYERLGMKLDNLLIDEFQDTSRLQWHNLKPLVANSIAEGHDDLIIGDEKQAIYRFRNSDSELLGSIVQTRDFPTSHRLRGHEKADNTNHRSAGDIVRANNSLFARLAPLLGADSYANVVQTPSERFARQPAYFRLQFVGDDVDENGILAAMAADILRQHEAGYRWRDILILTRERKEATRVVEFLTENHPEIKVLSSESLLLSSSPAVRTIMSMLKLVERAYATQGSASATADAGAAPRYASRSDIFMMLTRFNYFTGQGYDGADALKLAIDRDAGSAASLDAEITAIRAENPANLVALIDAIIHHKLSAEQRSAEYAYIAALQDLAMQHAESADPSLARFIAAYDTYIDKWAIKASAHLDAVEVMTIHKSKGLERDCVHIPFADWKMTHGTQSTWLSMERLKGFDPEIVPPILHVKVSSKMALRNHDVSPFADIFDHNDRLEAIDSLNLCYVAFTRASRELCVFSGTKNIGRHLFDAVSIPTDTTESTDPSRLPLNEFFDEDKATLTVGEPTTKEAQPLPERTFDAGEYNVVYRGDTRELTSIDDVLATHLDIGDEEDKMTVDSFDADASDKLLEAARKGNILHAILASVRTLSDLRGAVARHGARMGLSETEQEECFNELNAAIVAGGDEAAAWFDPVCKIYAERSFYVAESGRSFRPDRIVVRPDGLTSVIDYKFTSEPRPEHFAQVENYLTLLAAIGRTDARAYLWYPLLGRIVRLG